MIKHSSESGVSFEGEYEFKVRNQWPIKTREKRNVRKNHSVNIEIFLVQL